MAGVTKHEIALFRTLVPVSLARSCGTWGYYDGHNQTSDLIAAAEPAVPRAT